MKEDLYGLLDTIKRAKETGMDDDTITQWLTWVFINHMFSFDDLDNGLKRNISPKEYWKQINLDNLEED